MSALIEARVPDIGDYTDVPVIEVLVNVGDTVSEGQSLVTLESDKATMEVPSSAAGVVKELKVKVGDTLSEGAVVAVLEAAASAQAAPKADSAASAPAQQPQQASAQHASVQEARVPDIGDYADVPVIEVLVKVGDTVSEGQSLVTLESDKATMEVPSSVSGVVQAVQVAVGDAVSEGTVVALIAAQHASQAAPTAATAAPAASAPAPSVAAVASAAAPAPAPAPAPSAASTPPSAPPLRFEADAVWPSKVPYASPAVRLFARELGVDLMQVTGSARGGRITREDVQKFVKQALASGAGQGAASGQAGAGLGLLPWPVVDFSKFGEVSVQPLSRIKKISGANLARNWVMIPHVTHQEDADITDLEALRVQLNKENEKAKSNIKLTMLAFLMKASVQALKKFPEFNASLDASGENLTLKNYFHIGFAADTPNGLVVPVVRDCDKKGINAIAEETGALAKLAREGKLTPAQMSGGCFTISSLGGIGGTGFTPIVNAPEVAILGVTRSAMKPVWNGSAFEPRLMLPLSLSYDHRVIDGAAAARFAAYLASLLADMRRVLL